MNQFCTIITCIDGQIQNSVSQFVLSKFDAKFADIITEPGPCKILSKHGNVALQQSIFNRLKISVEKHNSNQIALVAHEDCTGNQTEKEAQIQLLFESKQWIESRFPDAKIMLLWANLDETIIDVLESKA